MEEEERGTQSDSKSIKLGHLSVRAISVRRLNPLLNAYMSEENPPVVREEGEEEKGEVEEYIHPPSPVDIASMFPPSPVDIAGMLGDDDNEVEYELEQEEEREEEKRPKVEEIIFDAGDRQLSVTIENGELRILEIGRGDAQSQISQDLDISSSIMSTSNANMSMSTSVTASKKAKEVREWM